jgi:SOS-response transcriptional repressor LexA
MKLTEKQRAVLGFISQSVRERGYPPTVREIGAALGIKSTNGVNDHLTALERKGAIRRDPLVSRGITVTLLRDDDHERALLLEAARCAPAAAVHAALSAMLEVANAA